MIFLVRRQSGLLWLESFQRQANHWWWAEEKHASGYIENLQVAGPSERIKIGKLLRPALQGASREGEGNEVPGNEDCVISITFGEWFLVLRHSGR
jgi:hypothetical protein